MRLILLILASFLSCQHAINHKTFNSTSKGEKFIYNETVFFRLSPESTITFIKGSEHDSIRVDGLLEIDSLKGENINYSLINNFKEINLIDFNGRIERSNLGIKVMVNEGLVHIIHNSNILKFGKGSVIEATEKELVIKEKSTFAKAKY